MEKEKKEGHAKEDSEDFWGVFQGENEKRGTQGEIEKAGKNKEKEKEKEDLF